MTGNKRAIAPQTVGEALQICEERLAAADLYYGHGTDNPWDEAVQLVLAVVELPLDSGDGVLPHPVSENQWSRLCALLEKRIGEHIPLPYLLGRAWFAGLELHCDERAIIPRSPIAELIVNRFSPWYAGPGPRRVLDLCCGGGCIGLACAHYFEQVSVDLVDIDGQALELARENARVLGVEERVSFYQGDLCEVPGEQRYDLLLSNPPYVDARELAAMPAEYLSEPPIALGAGTDGLDLARRILALAGAHLQPEGLLVMEVGASWPALEAAYPTVPFTWVEFEQGGEGVLAMSAPEWQDYSASLRG